MSVPASDPLPVIARTLIGLALMAIPASQGFAAVDAVPPSTTWNEVGAQEDNDFFYLSPRKTDGLYTQGLRLYGRYHEALPAPGKRDRLQRVMASIGGGWWHTSPITAYAAGLAAGQEIYTPTSAVTGNPPSAPVNNDQPYVGWLYGAVTGEVGSAQSHDRLELDIGTVGPPSAGSATQTYVHRLIHNTRPAGWSHQVHGEPGLDILYRHDEWLPGTLTAADGVVVSDADAHLTGIVGNIHTQVEAGIEWRLGWNLSHAGGPQGDPGVGMATRGWRRWSFGLTVGYNGRAVARNIFLDGNTFRNSAHVTKRPFVNDFTYGLVTGFAVNGNLRFDAAYIEVIRSHEFYGADHDDRFASLVAAVTWVP